MAIHSYARLVESVRRTRNTLYLVAGLYIAAGFVVAVATAMQHDRLGTFLGFIIISGALSLSLIARTALQVLVRVGHIEKSLDGFAERADRLIPFILSNRHSATATVQDVESLIDLTKIGSGDPQMLAAATLNRERFPRLVVAVETTSSEGQVGHGRGSAGGQMSDEIETEGGPTTRDGMPQWEAALAVEDLAKCRRVYTALAGRVEEDILTSLTRQIKELENRCERKLREQFAMQVRSREYAAALETGGQIGELLAGRPVAADFERLRPILCRRAQEELTTSTVAS